MGSDGANTEVATGPIGSETFDMTKLMKPYKIYWSLFLSILRKSAKPHFSNPGHDAAGC